MENLVLTMSEEDTLSGRGRSQQLGRMGEYAVMAQLLAKSWVSNVYSPAADTGVDIVLLTKEGKMKKIQVKTSRVYPSKATWFMNISKAHLEPDSPDPEMSNVLAEGHLLEPYLLLRAGKLFELFQTRFVGTSKGRLVRFRRGPGRN